MVSKIAHLDIRVDDDGTTTFDFSGTSEAPIQVGPVPNATIEAMNALRSENITGSEDQTASIARRWVTTAVPPGVERRLEEWTHADSKNRFLVLRVYDQAEPWADIPWELLPAAFRANNLMVVRSLPHTPLEPKDTLHELRVLVAGWPAGPNGSVFSGIQREVTDLPQRIADRRTTVRTEGQRSWVNLAKSAKEFDPHIIQLSPFTIMRDRTSGEMLMPTDHQEKSSEGEFGGLRTRTLHDIGDLAEGSSDLRMVIINASRLGQSAFNHAPAELCARLLVPAFSWAGLIMDRAAADFTFFFFQRIVEGMSPVEAVWAFTSNYGSWRLVGGGIPVLWVPDPDQLTARIIDPASEEDRAITQAEIDAHCWHRRVEIEVDLAQRLFPAFLKNGRPAIARLMITSTIEADAQIEILCDTGASQSTFSETVHLLVGSNPIERPFEFPALYELMERDEQRKVSFTVTISIDEKVVAQQTNSVQWRGRHEWPDEPDSWPFVPAFVQPMGDGVETLIGAAERVLTQIGSPSDSFDGYQRDDAKLVDLQMKAIYQALRDHNVKYINPPPPIYAGTVTGQLVRAGEDVMDRRHGTCHDLSLLLAGAAEYVNIYPLVVLTQGHTFMGYWRDRDAHADFWSPSRIDERVARFTEGAVDPGSGIGDKRSPSSISDDQARFGLAWTVDDVRDLVELARSNAVGFVEATFVTKPEKTFDDACSMARRRLTSVEHQPLDVAIDVWAARRSVRAL